MKDIICKDDEVEQKEIELLYDDMLRTLAMISKEEKITEQQLSAILRTEDFEKYREQIKESCAVGQISLHDYIGAVIKGEFTSEVGELPNKTNVFDVINVCSGFLILESFII